MSSLQDDQEWRKMIDGTRELGGNVEEQHYSVLAQTLLSSSRIRVTGRLELLKLSRMLVGRGMG